MLVANTGRLAFWVINGSVMEGARRSLSGYERRRETRLAGSCGGAIQIWDFFYTCNFNHYPYSPIELLLMDD